MKSQRKASQATFSFPVFCTLVFLASLCDVTKGQRCPSGCNCFGTFVACHEFTTDQLASLPGNAETLVLSSGNITSFPPRFLQQFPHLTFFEIQSSQVESVKEGTFAGVENLDQLAITDCRFGSLEEGAFSNMSAVSQFLLSGSTVRTIHTRAFSSLHNVGEFSIWSTLIGEVKSMAFTNLSDFHSFSFYLNNVTTLASNAFNKVKNFGKVDVYLNRFDLMQGDVMMPLNAATKDMNLYSNIFACDCGVLQTFHRPLLSRFLMSQKCLMPGSKTEVRLSEVTFDQVCLDTKPSTTSSASMHTTETQKTTKKTTGSKPATDSNQGFSHPISHETTTPEVSTPTGGEVTEGTHSGKGQKNELSDGNTNKGHGVRTQTAFVFLAGIMTIAWIVSVL